MRTSANTLRAYIKQASMLSPPSLSEHGRHMEMVVSIELPTATAHRKAVVTIYEAVA